MITQKIKVHNNFSINNEFVFLKRILTKIHLQFY